MASYKKQNFKDGEKLNASMLNHIEAGIVSLEKAISTLAKGKDSHNVKEILLLKDEDGNIVEGNATLKNGTVVPIKIETK